MAAASPPPPAPAPASAPTVAWDCAGLPRSRFCLLVLNQPIAPALIPLFKQLWSAAQLRVAADGGANSIYAIREHLFPATTTAATRSPLPPLDAIVGDLDSLSADAHAYFSSPSPASSEAAAAPPPPPGTRIIRHRDDESTDFTKAVEYIWDGHHSQHDHHHDSGTGTGTTTTIRSPLDIICVGGLGGRVDQGISTLHHLFKFQQGENGGGGGGEDAHGYARGRLWLLGGESLTFMLSGGGARHEIRVREESTGTNAAPSSAGASEATPPDSDRRREREDEERTGPLRFAQHVGILPAREPSVISTRGLEWDVAEWPTALGSRVSTSNHLTARPVVHVTSSRDVLFTLALDLS